MSLITLQVLFFSCFKNIPMHLFSTWVKLSLWLLNLF